MDTNLDVGILGIGDDSSMAGHVRSKIVRGDLVKVPFRNNSYITVIYGAPGTSVTFEQYGSVENGDGSNSCLFIAIPSTYINYSSGAIVKFWFYGTVFGIRHYTQYLGNNAYFGTLIDGMPFMTQDSDYEPKSPTLPESQQGNFLNNERLDVLVDDLPDGKHLCEIYFPGNPVSGSINNGWEIWGYTAERRVGYTDFPRPIIPQGDPSVLTMTSSVIVNTANADASGGSSTATYRYLRSIVYTNTGNNPTQVFLANHDGTIIWQSVLQASGSQGCSDIFDPKDKFVGNTSYYHYASSGSVVNATVFGGF